MQKSQRPFAFAALASSCVPALASACVLALALSACGGKSTGATTPSSSDKTGGGGGGGGNGAGVPALPIDLPAKAASSAIPAGLAATDAFATVLSCGDFVEVAELEGRPVVVRWDSKAGTGDKLFRLARWDEASAKFEEQEGPRVHVDETVNGIMLTGTWKDPTLFVLDTNVGVEVTGGRRSFASVNGKIPYRVASHGASGWKVAQGEYAVPAGGADASATEKLDEDTPTDKRLDEAVAKIAAATKPCEKHDGMDAFTHGWKTGHVVGKGCAKPIAFAVHQRKDGEVETYSWPTTNDAPDFPRVQIEPIDHAWHVFVQKPKLAANKMIMDKMFRYDGAKLAPIDLPADEVSGKWRRGNALCVGGAKSMWCKGEKGWTAFGKGDCELAIDTPELQSGYCRRGQKFAPIVGDGKGELRELTPLAKPAVCRPVQGRTVSTVLCDTTLAFLPPAPAKELDFAIPPYAFDEPVVFIGDVAWAARGKEKIVTRLGKPVKPWTCSEDGAHLEQK